MELGKYFSSLESFSNIPHDVLSSAGLSLKDRGAVIGATMAVRANLSDTLQSMKEKQQQQQLGLGLTRRNLATQELQINIQVNKDKEAEAIASTNAAIGSKTAITDALATAGVTDSTGVAITEVSKRAESDTTPNQYLTLHVYKNKKRMFYPQKPYMSAPYSNNPHTLVRFDVPPGETLTQQSTTITWTNCCKYKNGQETYFFGINKMLKMRAVHVPFTCRTPF